MRKANKAYSLWWTKVKNMDKADGCRINPFASTDL